ncbi:hypothetical protein BDV59DRAFT_205282 [Aspergillus ambiguus]|uniref:uncharacterized protein n=1 Tax=Aspergillus ambiguus TaxID=176160 RepID=UPI003CCD966F
MDAHYTSLSQEALDGLLRPAEHFNWADEVEETLEVPEPVSPLLPSTASLASSLSSSVSETLDDIWSEEEDSSFAASVSSFPETDSEYSAEYELENHVREAITTDVCLEFDVRNQCMQAAAKDGEQVHHFNWFGQAVPQHSGTPAAVSLMFILAIPRVPHAHKDSLRFWCIFNQAKTYVDPVVVCLEDSNGTRGLFQRGRDLVDWATGRTYKFYTGHGSWTQDDRERADETVEDIGDVDLYTSGNIAAANGFVRLSTMRSRQQWKHEFDYNYNFLQFRTASSRSTRGCRNGRKTFTASPLRQVMTVEEDKTGQVAGDESLRWSPAQDSVPARQELDTVKEPTPAISQPEGTQRSSGASRLSIDCPYSKQLLKAESSDPNPRSEGFKPILRVVDEVEESVIEETHESDSTTAPTMSNDGLKDCSGPRPQKLPPPRSNASSRGLRKAKAKWRKFKEGSWTRLRDKARRLLKPKGTFESPQSIDPTHHEPPLYAPGQSVTKYVSFPAPYFGRRHSAKMLFPCYRKKIRRGELFEHLTPDACWDFANRLDGTRA